MKIIKKEPRQGLKKGIYILPNLFTTAGLFCGFFAIIRSINGDFITASWAILLATVFDSLDGRVARMTRTQSKFGIEYDSLTDLTSFGMAPAILMYKWTLFHFDKLGWMAAFVFFASAALRLARFNVQSDNVEKKSFQGLPTPAAAGFQATYVIFHNYFFGKIEIASYFVLVLTFLLGFLMISNVSYFSLKATQLNRRASFAALAAMVGLFAVIAAAPQVMLFVVAVGYVTHGLLTELWRSLKKIQNLSRYAADHKKEGEIAKTSKTHESAKVVSLGRRADDGK